MPNISFVKNILGHVGSRNVLCISSRNKVSVGRYKTSRYRTFPLTYEQAIKPHDIGVRKSWLTWHTSNLEGMSIRQPQIVIEDEFIRRFMYGTWHQMFVDQLVIKRRGNLIVIAGILLHRSSTKIYWLIGYTEEFLSFVLKQPVRLELQTIKDKKEIVYMYI